MKFTDRSALERTAIDAWIRVSVMIREEGYMKVSDTFKTDREKNISEYPEGIPQMLECYAAYQKCKPPISYTQYFQVSHPDEYAQIVQYEKNYPKAV